MNRISPWCSAASLVCWTMSATTFCVVSEWIAVSRMSGECWRMPVIVSVIRSLVGWTNKVLCPSRAVRAEYLPAAKVLPDPARASTVLIIICLYLSILGQWHREVLPRVSVPHLFSQGAGHEFKFHYGFRDADQEGRGGE